MKAKALSHIDRRGEARMVDVSTKPVQTRVAVAEGVIGLQKTTLRLIQKHAIAKGNVLATARIAGVMAAKRTSELIPFCHPLALAHCQVDFEFRADRIRIVATVRINASTGVEMEALTAVTIAALTIYDMCKAVDKKMTIGQVRLVSKTKLNVPKERGA